MNTKKLIYDYILILFSNNFNRKRIQKRHDFIKDSYIRDSYSYKEFSNLIYFFSSIDMIERVIVPIQFENRVFFKKSSCKIEGIKT